MDTYFIIGLAFILAHEMDAIRCKEWRIFPGLSMLSDKLGATIFMLAHLPLFYWIACEIMSNNDRFMLGFSYFLIAHLVLHLFFLMHKKNEFKDWLSWFLIVGAAVSGGLYVIG